MNTSFDEKLVHKRGIPHRHTERKPALMPMLLPREVRTLGARLRRRHPILSTLRRDRNYDWLLSMSVVVALPCGSGPPPCRLRAGCTQCRSACHVGAGRLVCAGVRGVDARLQPDPFQRVTSGATRDRGTPTLLSSLSYGEATASGHARHAVQLSKAGKAVAGRRPAVPVPANSERSWRLRRPG